MRKIARLFSLALLAAIIVSAFTGCHTVRGAGQDIQRGGEKVQDVAS